MQTGALAIKVSEHHTPAQLLNIVSLDDNPASVSVATLFLSLSVFIPERLHAGAVRNAHSCQECQRQSQCSEPWFGVFIRLWLKTWVC